ncbi:MAG: hypothetical protein ACLGHE_09790 [Gammaproteobacteria bacterium]
MPALTPEQIAYVERRRRQIRYWPWVALLLTAVLVALYGGLWLTMPWFVDPQALVAGLRDGSIDTNALAMLAALGNLAFVGCGLLILVIIVFTSVALWNEHRLIRYLDLRGLPSSAAIPACPPDDKGDD